MYKINFFLHNDETGQVYTTYVETIDSVESLEDILGGEVIYIEKDLSAATE